MRDALHETPDRGRGDLGPVARTRQQIRPVAQRLPRDAQTLADHYLHHMTVGTISRRGGLNRSTIHGKEHDLAEILSPSAGRILDDWRKAPVKAADETTWPCNGVPGYVYGFFSKEIL